MTGVGGKRWIGAGVIALVLAAATSARAETVEVAPGVRVTKTSFNAPINEQPFFGFAEKTDQQRAIDDKFVTDILAAAGSREKAFDAAVQRGWGLIGKGSYAEAAKRFNQAYLLSPAQSAIYHSFAVIAAARFNDQNFADELFKQALKQPGSLKALNADYGRFLLIAKRPKEALPVLEKAVLDAPDFPDAWSNLAFARLENGDSKGACAAAAEAEKQKPSINVMGDINILKRRSSCN